VRNVDYAQRIIGLGESFFNRDDFLHFNLYNPFGTIYLYLAFGFMGLLLSRKNLIFGIWFVGVLLIYRYLISYSGLHIYNIFIPLIVLVGYTFDSFFKLRGHVFTLFSYVLTPALFIFLGLQSYLLFIDPTPAYPLEREKILWFKTREYTNDDDIRHKTGFPHRRKWNEINNLINTLNSETGENLAYITNEDKGISRFYMDANMGTGERYYAIGIKDPLSFAFDYQFPQIKGKHTIYKVKNENGNTVAQIYFVDGN